METRKTKLALTASALAFALMLAGCGGGGGSSSSAVTPSGGGDPNPPAQEDQTPQPMATSGNELTVPQTEALLALLPDAGDEYTLEIAAGDSAMRGGVTFMCASDYDCDVMLKNDLGTIVATWDSQNIDGGMTADVTAMAMPVIPQPKEVSGSVTPHGADELRALAGVFAQDVLLSFRPVEFTIPAGGMTIKWGMWFTCESDHDCDVQVKRDSGGIIISSWTSMQAEGGMADVTVKLPKRFGPFPEMNAVNLETLKDTNLTTEANTTVGGLGLDDRGPMSFDDVELTSNLNPNASGHTPQVVNLSDGSITTAASGGSTMTYMDDKVTENTQVLMFSGWKHRAMFRDWGDVKKDDPKESSDGGFETAAVIYADMMDPESHPWDDKLADKFVKRFNLPGIVRADGAANPYDFTVDLLDKDGMRGGTPDNTNDTVAFTVTTGKGITPGGEGSYVNANAAGAGSLGITVTADQDGAFRAVTGRYLGVSGTYTCGTTDCALSRTEGTDNFTLGTGDWQFTPNEGAMVAVPDQDWMVFGHWVTAPNDPEGDHAHGAFFFGMDPYNYSDAKGATSALAGKATYTGGATGSYSIDREEPEAVLGQHPPSADEYGQFFANATLNADFGTDMLSGEINKFRDVSNRYLGSDNQYFPNDPDKGGDGDWHLTLDATTITGDGSFGAGNTGTISGSADGHKWEAADTDTNYWTAQLYGPHMDGTKTVQPSSVGGRFQANIEGNAIRIRGAFGAHKTE